MIVAADEICHLQDMEEYFQAEESLHKLRCKFHIQPEVCLKVLCCISVCRQYCSYLGPVGSGKQYGRANTTNFLVLRFGSELSFLGIVYC